MGKWVVITEEQLQELNEERKNTQNKRYDLRLHAVALRGEGMKCREIAEKLDVTPQTVSVWCLAYSKEGLDGIKNGVFGQNHRNMSFQEEEELLATFKNRPIRARWLTHATSGRHTRQPLGIRSVTDKSIAY